MGAWLSRPAPGAAVASGLGFQWPGTSLPTNFALLRTHLCSALLFLGFVSSGGKEGRNEMRAETARAEGGMGPIPAKAVKKEAAVFVEKAQNGPSSQVWPLRTEAP